MQKNHLTKLSAFHEKNSTKIKKKNLLKIIKAIYEKPTAISYHQTQWQKTESFTSQIRNKTSMPTSATC